MFTLQVRRRIAGAPGPHGNTPYTLSYPMDWEVRGIAPGSMEEPGKSNRDLSLIAWTVYADKSDDAPGGDDVVVFDGDEFEVEGEPADWTMGPWFMSTAGIVVELRRAEG